MWADHHLREETPFPTIGSGPKLGLFCCLQSNHRAKFVPSQGPSRELITHEVQKEISNCTVYVGTADTRAANKQYRWPSHRDSQLTWLMGGISCAHADVDLWDKLIPSKAVSMDLLGFVCCFFTCGSAFTLKIFSMIQNFHCFLIFHILGCTALLLSPEGGQNSGAYDTQEAACVPSAHSSPHTLVTHHSVFNTNS